MAIPTSEEVVEASEVFKKFFLEYDSMGYDAAQGFSFSALGILSSGDNQVTKYSRLRSLFVDIIGYVEADLENTTWFDSARREQQVSLIEAVKTQGFSSALIEALHNFNQSR